MNLVIEKYKELTGSFHFYFDKKGRFWFIHWNPAVPVIYCFDLKTAECTAQNFEFYSSLKSYHEIYGLFEQQDGTIWAKGTPVFAKFLDNEKKFRMVA